MQVFDRLKTRLALLRGRHADARIDEEFRFHLEMERERLLQSGLPPDEAHRHALMAFGGVVAHKEALRDGRGLAWLASTSLDFRLGGRMLIKYPVLPLAGGLAIAIAIGLDAGWFDITGRILAPTIPLPDGDRLVTIATIDTASSAPEAHIGHDFLEWRRSLRSVEALGAWRTETRNLVVGRQEPIPLVVAASTAEVLRAASVAPVRGRLLTNADEVPGAPAVVVVAYGVWQRRLGAREDVIGLAVTLGAAPATVVGVMPKDFAYPYDHDGWVPLTLPAVLEPRDGPTIEVIGRLARGATVEQANAELRTVAAAAATSLPDTHRHLHPSVVRLGAATDFLQVAQLAARNGPVLLVLAIACMSVGTLIYARTATREGEIAIRAALGAGRARIVGQLFVEALVLALVAAALGLLAADRTLAWGIEAAGGGDGVPFWMRGGLSVTTILYAVALAVVCAVMLSLLPALRITRANLQPHLANLGSGRATLRFGRLWTTVMVAQVALTAVGLPGAMESTRQTLDKIAVRSRFPSRDFAVATLDLDAAPSDALSAGAQARRTATFDMLSRRLDVEAGVRGVTFADRLPGVGGRRQDTWLEPAQGAPAVRYGRVISSTVAPNFFATFGRAIVAGRGWDATEPHAGANTVVVNEAFARRFASATGTASPLGARLHYRTGALRTDAAETLEVVGVVSDLGLDPDDDGQEQPAIFHVSKPAALSPLLIAVRIDGDAAELAARLPRLAADVDLGLLVQQAQPMDAWVRDTGMLAFLAAQLGVTGLILLLSALGVFSLVSVGVSRRTREIGLRVSLGATPRMVISRVLASALRVTAAGILAGGVLLMAALVSGMGPAGTPAADVPVFLRHLTLSALVMLVASLLACIGPVARALRISPADALRSS